MKTMKLNKLFFAVLMALTVFTVGCSKDEDVVKDQSKIDTEDILATIEKGSKSITFYAANDWTASLSTTSWVKIDPMTKAGVKGNAEVKIEWEANTGIKERVADLTILVNGESPVKIRITQLPDQPIVTVSKESLNLLVDKMAANGKGQFVDTISVKSNIKWTLKNMPAWIEYSTVGDKEPQEGVSTDIKLVVTANPKKFNATEMVGAFQIGKADATDLDATVEVKAVTELKALDEDKNPVSKLILVQSAGTGNKYAASFRMVSNTSWTLKEYPKWATPSKSNNSEEYAENLHSEITVWFAMETKNLDTEELRGNVVFVNEQTKTEVSMEIIFPGTGVNFFEFTINLTPDTYFDATNMDEQWNPIPGAFTELNFTMYSGKDYSSINEAPYRIHFVNTRNGLEYPEEAFWLGVDMAAGRKATKSPLISKQLTLWVQSRNMDFANKYENRYALMVITPKNVEFDDLFGDNGKLKLEYRDIAIQVNQKGFNQEGFESAIPEVVNFAAAPGEQEFEVFKAFFIRHQMEDDSWASIEYLLGDYDKVEGMKIKVNANTTGQARSQKVQMLQYKEANDTEEVVYEFTINQAAE